jgi:putative MFS transporter
VLPFAPSVVLVVTFLSYAIGMGAATVLELVYPAELFPTPIRATATGFAAAISRVGAFFGTFLLPIGMAQLGVKTVILGACALSLVGLAISLLWAPETKDRLIA